MQKGKTTKELNEKKDILYQKNTYLHLFKNEEKLRKESIAEKTGKNIVFVYD